MAMVLAAIGDLFARLDAFLNRPWPAPPPRPPTVWGVCAQELKYIATSAAYNTLVDVILTFMPWKAFNLPPLLELLLDFFGAAIITFTFVPILFALFQPHFVVFQPELDDLMITTIFDGLLCVGLIYVYVIFLPLPVPVPQEYAVGIYIYIGRWIRLMSIPWPLFSISRLYLHVLLGLTAGKAVINFVVVIFKWWHN